MEDVIRSALPERGPTGKGSYEFDIGHNFYGNTDVPRLGSAPIKRVIAKLNRLDGVELNVLTSEMTVHLDSNLKSYQVPLGTTFKKELKPQTQGYLLKGAGLEIELSEFYKLSPFERTGGWAPPRSHKHSGDAGIHVKINYRGEPDRLKPLIETLTELYQVDEKKHLKQMEAADPDMALLFNSLKTVKKRRVKPEASD